MRRGMVWCGEEVRAEMGDRMVGGAVWGGIESGGVEWGEEGRGGA